MKQAYTAVCRRCGDGFLPGDEFYDVPELGSYCPDCMDALLAHWRRREGDVTDRI